MSGFSPAWLALREPADTAARVPELVADLAAWLRVRPRPRLLDLGCGTGSTVRALAERMPGGAVWHLVDHDPALIAAAQRKLAGAPVTFETVDFAGDLALIGRIRPDVITGSALIDLVSERWLEDLAAAAVASDAGVYMALAYDGVEAWLPPHAADPAIQAAFLADQRSDKGFGPALGPDAGARLADLLRDAGYAVTTAESPWRLTSPRDADLIAALADGIAEAAGRHWADGEAVAAWRDARRQADSVSIGHIDVLGLPPG